MMEKKSILSSFLLLSMAGTFAAFAVGCGDSSSSADPEISSSDSADSLVVDTVKTVKRLGDCTEDNAGAVAFVLKDSTEYTCSDSVWVKVESSSSESSSSAKSSASGESSSDSKASSSSAKGSSSSSEKSSSSAVKEKSSSSAVLDEVYLECATRVDSVLFRVENGILSYEAFYDPEEFRFFDETESAKKSSYEQDFEEASKEAAMVAALVKDSSYACADTTEASVKALCRLDKRNPGEVDVSAELDTAIDYARYRLYLKIAVPYSEENLADMQFLEENAETGCGEDGKFVLAQSSKGRVVYSYGKGSDSLLFAASLKISKNASEDTLKNFNVFYQELVDASQNGDYSQFAELLGIDASHPVVQMAKISGIGLDSGKASTSMSITFLSNSFDDYATFIAALQEISEDSVNNPFQNLSLPTIFGTFSDARDGKAYRTVKIGEQTWMSENLTYSSDEFSSYCYEDNADSCAKYGRYYAWSAAMDSAGIFSEGGMGCGFTSSCSPVTPVRGVCPSGWHLPDTTEWNALVASLAESFGDDFEAFRDGLGFSELPGVRYSDGSFSSAGQKGIFWSSTQKNNNLAYQLVLYGNNGTVGLSEMAKANAVSVRCVKDSD